MIEMAQAKENTISSMTKYALGTISVIGTIIGAFLAVDARYVLAADFDKYQAATQRDVARQTTEIQRQGLILRKQLLEDRVFELDAKKGETQHLSPVEDAQYRRYLRQLIEVESSMQQLEKK